MIYNELKKEISDGNSNLHFRRIEQINNEPKATTSIKDGSRVGAENNSQRVEGTTNISDNGRMRDSSKEGERSATSLLGDESYRSLINDFDYSKESIKEFRENRTYKIERMINEVEDFYDVVENENSNYEDLLNALNNIKTNYDNYINASTSQLLYGKYESGTEEQKSFYNLSLANDDIKFINKVESNFLITLLFNIAYRFYFSII